MKRIFRLTALVLCVIMMAALLSCCSALFEDEKDKGTNSDSAAEVKSEMTKFTEEELAKPVITIGQRTVSLKEYVMFFDQLKTYYSSSYGYDITSDEETLTQYKDLIAETLIKETMQLHMADEYGLTDFSEEQLAEIEAAYESDKEEMYSYYTDLVKSEVEDPEDEAAINKKVDQYIIEEAEYYMGSGATIDDYLKYLKEQAEKTYIFDLLEEYVVKDVEVSDKDVETWYNDGVKADKEYFKEHPEAYKEECDSFEITGFISDGKTAVSPLYIPKGYSRIYHIFTTVDADTSDDYEKNQKEMANLEEEYGALAFDVALNGSNETSTNRMNQIIEKYNELKEENNAELKKLYKDAKTKINKAYNELEDGESFKNVMVKYTEDSNFIDCEEIKDNGMLISSEYTSVNDWSAEVKAQFRKLSVGEYSKVFMDDDGYHIIYVVSKVSNGTVQLKDARKQIRNSLINEERETYFENQLTEWIEDTSKIVKDEGFISRVGK